ncbi:MAG: nucleotide-binding domain containing protein [Spirosomataceae bacterium]
METIEHKTPILVISGSCSPISAYQIAWAENNGFGIIGLDTAALVAGVNTDSILEQISRETIEKLQMGQSVIVHTSNSNTDPRIEKTKQMLENQGYTALQIQTLTAQVFGNALGTIATTVLANTKVERMVVAGGDTSSYAARAMGIEAVEMLAPLTPGAPICLLMLPGSSLDKKQIIFKGGQVGTENYYGRIGEIFK